MKVLKFGGTSVGTVESLSNVKSIVESINEPVIVVVSALGGLTDKLIATAKKAAEGDNSYKTDYDSIIDRHHNIINGIVKEEYREKVTNIIDSLLEELGNVYLGISLLEDLSENTLDRVVSFGERMSSVIVAHTIDDATHFDSPEFIRTVRHHGRHILDSEVSETLINQAFTSRVWKRAVAPGFISKDANGRYTNLGRGGSDYTAAILAAALNADILEIWTDVDGFMTADPRIIQDAHVIEQLSFIEAMELCNFGAKVIYPPTIYPVFNKNIPIYIKNTLRPWMPGTCISDTPHAADPTAPDASFSVDKPKREISGVTSLKDTCLIKLSGTSSLQLSKQNARLASLLSRSGVNIYNLMQEEQSDTYVFAVRSSESERAVEAIENEFAPELQTGVLKNIEVTEQLATIALVGDSLVRRGPDFGSEVADTISSAGINIIARGTGTSATTISVIVSLADEHKALKSLHDRYLKYQSVSV